LEAVSGIELWRATARWRRKVERDLVSLELTLTQWLVLLALCDAIDETQDAVSQSTVAERAQIDRVTVSHVMRALEARGMLDRAAAARGRELRVWITSRGRKTLTSGTAQVERSSRDIFGRLRLSHQSFQAALSVIQAADTPRDVGLGVGFGD
jgi:DNA-binding MarR family transcriptional regulator